MLQTVAISFYPEWLRALEAQIGSLRTRAACANLHDCVQTLVTGSCDIMICYADPSSPLLLDGGQYPSLCVADEYLLPVSAPHHNGMPLHDLDRSDGRSVSYLGYVSYASLATMVDSIISVELGAPTFDLCYESALAAALKAMALPGCRTTW